MSSFAPLIAIGPNHRMRDSVFDLTESVANKRESERAHARTQRRPRQPRARRRLDEKACTSPTRRPSVRRSGHAGRGKQIKRRKSYPILTAQPVKGVEKVRSCPLVADDILTWPIVLGTQPWPVSSKWLQCYQCTLPPLRIPWKRGKDARTIGHVAPRT